MPIKTNTDGEVRRLVEDLAGADAARREAAIARLIIIGPRAIGRLTAAFDTAGREKQTAILRVLASSGDDRALPIARQALRAGGDVAVAATEVLADLLSRGGGRAHTEALEVLLALSIDSGAEHRVRAAAAEVLGQAPSDIRDAVGTALPPESSDDALWEDAAEGHLPDDPHALREALAARADRTPLASLQKLIEQLKDREQAVDEGAQREAWRTVRGAVHQALALRGSRIALYDLRETVESARAPLPSPFLAALHAAGDASCLEPIAAAFAHASDPRWRHQLADAFHVVARRERVTKRHPAMRRALAKAPQLETGSPVS